MIHKIFLGTHNKGKIERYRQVFASLSGKLNREFFLVTPQDLNLGKFDVEENGENEQENAYIKAKAYWDILPADQKMPCLSLDTGCYFEGVQDDEQPGQKVKRIVGKGEEASDEEMVEFYKKLCTKYGGQIEGYYFDANCIYCGQASKKEKDLGESYFFDSDNPFVSLGDFTEVVFENSNKREIVLTNQVVGQLHPGFPMMSMWKGGITNKFKDEMTEEDYLEELSPFANALVELLESIPTKNDEILGKYESYMPVRRRSLAVLKINDPNSPDLGKYLGFKKNGNTTKVDMLTWPGGGVDEGESPAEAVLREITEELGFTKLELKKELGGKIIHYFDGVKYKVCSVTYGFEVDILDMLEKIPAEIDSGIYTISPITKNEFLEECKIDIANEFLKRAV